MAFDTAGRSGGSPPSWAALHLEALRQSQSQFSAHAGLGGRGAHSADVRTTQRAVLTGGHTPPSRWRRSAVVDVLQTPACASRSTSFMPVRPRQPVNIKKAVRLRDMARWWPRHVRRRSTGGDGHTIWCERGVSSATPSCPTCVRLPSCAKPAARWCLTPRIPCSCRAGRARHPGCQRNRSGAGAAAVAAGDRLFMET